MVLGTTVFVGGMPRGPPRRDDERDAEGAARLRRWFARFGPLSAAEPPRAMMHRGFGLVTYDCAAAAAAAVAGVREAAPGGVRDADGLLCRHAELAKEKPPPAPPAPPPPPPPPPAENPRWAGTNLILAVVKSHAPRVGTYLRAAELPVRVDVLDAAAVGATRGDSARQVELAVLRADGGHAGAAAAAGAMIADRVLSRAVRKVFAVDADGWRPDLPSAAALLAERIDAAAAALRGGCRGAAGAGTPRVGVRLQAFPAALLPRVVDALQAAEARAGCLWELSPQQGEVVASCVETRDGLRVGTAGSETYAGDMPSRAGRSVTADDAVSRAYFKIREAVDRAGVAGRFDFAGATAVDAGAAPGGWTKYLAEDQGCDRVYAVDPADLGLDPVPPAVRHMRCKVQDALPRIADELRAEGRRLDVFVSDLCPHVRGELVDVVRGVLCGGLLRPGGLVVLTFKLTHGHTEATRDLIAEQEARQLDGLLEPGATVMLHLMANRARERTLVGYAAAAPPPPPDAAALRRAGAVTAAEAAAVCAARGA